MQQELEAKELINQDDEGEIDRLHARTEETQMAIEEKTQKTVNYLNKCHAYPMQ